MIKQFRYSYRRHSVANPQGGRSAFTLVEMLVAVALISLMMLMFANVFQIAGDSIGKMRGISENDQRARSLQTIIKADIDKRTYRWVFPFAADEDVGAAGSHIGQRQGYIYISENNPNNDLDDVVQFTVSSNVTNANKDTTAYYGQALSLPQPATVSGTAPYAPPPTLAPNMGYLNQPDADDGVISPNNTGASTVAEVTYFVRRGILYRRILLLRDPLVGSDPQPRDYNTRNLFSAAYSAGQPPDILYPGSLTPTATTFWADFDYSAVFSGLSGTNTLGAKFLGTLALDNSGSPDNAIANPANRFGFSPNVSFPAGISPGIPKEFVSLAATDDLSNFIGRFTMQECSSTNFQYPQNLTSGGNVPTNPATVLALNAATGVVNSPDDFQDGPRRGEDILLTNVHSFDVRVWDDAQQSFVNLGTGTDYAFANRLTAYGPRFTMTETQPNIVNSVYDTWHPQVSLNGIAGHAQPPYLPRLVRSTDTIVTRPAVGYMGAWQNDFPYQVGDYVFPNVIPNGQPFFYRCVAATGTGLSGLLATDQPKWPQSANLTVVDRELVWIAVDNRKTLKAIQLQVRFLDTSSQQMRQLTIVQSLVD